MKTMRTDIINQLFLKEDFISYLEIGVGNFANFDEINAMHKYSVDSHKGDKCTFNMDSETFFSLWTYYYDVIFVDGLHTYEQAYRDIKNSIDYLCPGGFIVIHDCNPRKKKYTGRRGRGQETWNGDVYKAFVRIKHEMSDWSCFVVPGGCGILTERPVLKNIQIGYTSDLTWEHFSAHRKGLLQTISYDDYVKLLKNDI